MKLLFLAIILSSEILLAQELPVDSFRFYFKVDENLMTDRISVPTKRVIRELGNSSTKWKKCRYRIIRTNLMGELNSCGDIRGIFNSSCDTVFYGDYSDLADFRYSLRRPCDTLFYDAIGSWYKIHASTWNDSTELTVLFLENRVYLSVDGSWSILKGKRPAMLSTILEEIVNTENFCEIHLIEEAHMVKANWMKSPC